MKLLYAIIMVVLFSSITYAQMGNRYFWQSKIATSTVAADTTFPIEWEVATVYSDTLDMWFRVGAPDVGDWSSRDYFKVESGLTISIGPTPQLKKLGHKTANGTGFIYIVGYKKSRQY